MSKVFGQAMKKSSSRYQRQFGNSSTTYRNADAEAEAEKRAQRRRIKQAISKALDEKFGIEPLEEGARRGWLYNILPTTISEKDAASEERAGLDLFFCTEAGSFSTTVLYRPYFYVIPNTEDSLALELLQSTLARLYQIYDIAVVYKTDLDQPNHLNKIQGRPVLKLSFDNVRQLMDVREQLKVIVAKNNQRSQETTMLSNAPSKQDPFAMIEDLREYDVPYVVRVCTDLDIRVGTWYTITKNDDQEVVLSEPDRETKANPTFLAFDIECTKAPLKFPNMEVDEIFMISYMVSTPSGPQGFLIVSRSVVSNDVADFEYTPLPNYPGPFKIFNEANEKSLVERFFAEFQKLRPQIVVTYNGDFFDWPFLEARAKHHGIDMHQAIGFEQIGEEYRGRNCVHLDAFHWVQRDSYLPQGAQGLKAVTRYKLGYDPVEVDPEDMVRFAQEKPVHMATYSVSDAVATYYLYEKYVHLFIFSLCTIIPMGPEDVLRKGSGTLCETLLMVQACKKDIICPNKEGDGKHKFHNGHLLESETYIGGKVECLETGVYRSDIEYEFDLKPTAFQQLIDNIDRDLTFAIEVEGGLDRNKIVNYDEIRGKIIHELELLRDKPKRFETPYIYHLDVGAMYPNIILTNRLQPSAIVDDAMCAACDYNQSKNNCKRKMDWVWRGDYNPATQFEYDHARDQLAREPQRDGLAFHQLPEKEQNTLVAARLKTYAKKAYNKTKVTEEVMREDVVCMRENDFYVDTVRQFRDRRYEYKKLNKTWKKRSSEASTAAVKKEAEDRVLVYDSLQVAHKCILNSFYGYVMRKGARWRSMEMAGIVTKTGADIITQARKLVEQIGRPLELDTDGIWCILPGSFPDVYNFKTADGGSFKLEYPCVMLNADVHANFSNHQYQVLVDPEKGIYETRSECSIFFEVDGPYRCMVLPASTEEGKLLKKRYAVFNFDGSLAELKGFELKRRGELELVKTFQSQVFERFLGGSTLEECYQHVAEVANHWIDVIDTKGESLDDDELVDLISENRSMSRQLEDYNGQKGTSQTTAKRLGEFLGAEIIKDKGLNCKFIIAEQPYGAPVTERAIPTAIWKAEPNVMRHYLRKWLKAPGLDDDALDIRNVLDWDYYLDRLSKTIQKIITIPAALQKVTNPVPRVDHPDWLYNLVERSTDRFQQKSIRDMFQVAKKPSIAIAGDIEDFGSNRTSSKRPVVHKVQRKEPFQEMEVEVEERVSLAAENFPTWLSQRKQQWKQSRRERKYRIMGETDSEAKRSRKAVSVEGFMREAALAVSQREWHILEVREMGTFDASAPGASGGSGDFIVWAMIGKDSLQKIVVTVPRVVYISARTELTNQSPDILDFKEVEKHLPHGSSGKRLYEVSMSEYTFRKKAWTNSILPVDSSVPREDAIESIYESKMPLIERALLDFGSVMKVKPSAQRNGGKNFMISDLVRVDKASSGEYLNSGMPFKRVFLYVRVNQRTRSGIVVVYTSEQNDDDMEVDRQDFSMPTEGGQGSFCVKSNAAVWIIKPGARSGQRNLSSKQCDSTFSDLLSTICSSADPDSDYACVSEASSVKFKSLKFVETEDLAFSGANELLSSYVKANQGPTVVFSNSNKAPLQLRRYMSVFTSVPVVTMPFPPGPAHNPNLSSLPALNWEQPAVQLSLESLLFLNIISYPKRVTYSRYASVPLGNLGEDEQSALFNVNMSRLLQKNRSVSWASPSGCGPDLGVDFMPSDDGGYFPSSETNDLTANMNSIWADDEQSSGPIVRNPGCYRSISIEIDVQDLAIAALTDPANAVIHSAGGTVDPSSPNSVALFDKDFQMSKSITTVGDDMSTAVALSIMKTLVGSWLRDAIKANSLVADEALHHLYRIISDQNGLLHDPAVHRAISTMMKSTFMRLMTEIQRLGCTVVFASFNRIIVSTNKIFLADAEEHIDFVINTLSKKSLSDAESSFSKLTLRPRQYHSNLLFLDEYNFGSMLLERAEDSEGDEEDRFTDGSTENHPTAASVVTAWSMMNYLGSEMAQEYFRAIIGRFSKEVLRKQMELLNGASVNPFLRDGEPTQRLLAYKKKMISSHFAAYLTRAVSDIMRDESEDYVQPPFENDSEQKHPPLEFIKNVIAILELDQDVDAEVQMLKRSLLSQVGVAEYAKAAQWENPCPKFILRDVFCSECQDCKDINLCHIPPKELDEDLEKQWVCEDCGSPYDVRTIEQRLISMLHKKTLRYQLQDSRCSKTKRVTTRVLNPYPQISGVLKLDMQPTDTIIEVHLMKVIAELYELEDLQDLTESMIECYQN